MSQSGSANVFVHLTLSSGPSSPMETQSLSVMNECATFARKEKKNTHARFELLFHQPIVKAIWSRAKQKPGDAPAAHNNSGFSSSLCSSAARKKRQLIKINQTQ